MCHVKYDLLGNLAMCGISLTFSTQPPKGAPAQPQASENSPRQSQVDGLKGPQLDCAEGLRQMAPWHLRLMVHGVSGRWPRGLTRQYVPSTPLSRKTTQTDTTKRPGSLTTNDGREVTVHTGRSEKERIHSLILNSVQKQWAMGREMYVLMAPSVQTQKHLNKTAHGQSLYDF